MADSLDLNISNYDLNDILKLFSLKSNYDKNDLKKAKVIVSKMHPDKSTLPKKYFEFFINAYRILVDVYDFRENKKRETETNYDVCLDRDQETNNTETIKKFVKKDDFLKQFNKFFEENKLKNNETDAGYEEWLRSNNDICEKKARNRHDLNMQIEQQKKQLRSQQLVKRGEIIDSGNLSSGGLNNTNIYGEKMEEYSSNIFSKLRYEDLKKAHTETVIPVTNLDYENAKKYKNVDHLMQTRNTQNCEPISMKQSREFLSEKQRRSQMYSENLAFNIRKESQDAADINKKLMSKITYLTY